LDDVCALKLTIIDDLPSGSASRHDCATGVGAGWS
jgi:hypothetical protein